MAGTQQGPAQPQRRPQPNLDKLAQDRIRKALDQAAAAAAARNATAASSTVASSDAPIPAGRQPPHVPRAVPTKDAAVKARAARRLDPTKVEATSRADLDAYIRANGNMSVARRTGVVAPALVKLGYTPDEARTIALDAPLNSGMYDSGAILTALEYADSISNPPAGGTPIGQAAAGAVIPMPANARAALDAGRVEQMPEPKRTLVKAQRGGAQSDFGKALYTFTQRLARTIGPPSQRFANLPVPGGLGGMFLLNLLLLFFAVPANSQGYTRAALMYLTLLNRTKLPEPLPTQTVPASPMVQAAMNAAQGLQEIAGAVGSLGQAGQDVANLIQAPGKAVQSAGQAAGQGILGGLTGTLGIATGLPLSSNTTSIVAGGGPPPPPSAPAFPHAGKLVNPHTGEAGG